MCSPFSARCWLALLALMSIGCKSGSNAGRGAAAGGQERSVSVAAAADLRFAFEEVSAEFRKSHSGIRISVTYGSSGSFFAQLLNHAPFDLFLSADAEYPRKLAEAGLTVAGSEFVYGIGRIAVWVPAGSVIDVERIGMGTLAHLSVTHIAIANPRHAPYGRAAAAAMKSFGIYEAAAPKLVFGENAAQALQFVESGNAQVGIVALALALAPPVRGLGRYWEVPGDRYQRLEQGGVILRWVKDKDAATALRAFLMGPSGRPVLARYGFLPPGD